MVPVRAALQSYGDKAELAEFRSRLLVPVEIVDLPSIQEPLTKLTDLRASSQAVASELIRHSPEGPLRIAGYSFGANVAFEAARHLIDSGRDLGFLALIDLPSPTSPQSETDTVQEGRFGTRIIRSIRKISTAGSIANLTSRVLRELLGRLLFLRFKAPLPAGNGASPLAPSEPAVRRLLVYYFRRRAMEHWRPAPIEGPVFVAVSEENLSATTALASLCPQGQIVRLPGKHANVLTPPSLEILLSEFRAAMHHADLARPEYS